MFFIYTILLEVFLFTFILLDFPCGANLVASTRTRNYLMELFLHVRNKRATRWDFTELNLGLCPPSLCRAYDEKTGQVKERPVGTGGSIFYQGDIILDSKMAPYIFHSERGRRRKRATMRPRRRLWKNGIVVYKFAKQISPEAKKVIDRAMKHIRRRTCIRFREKKDKDRDFIRFISEPGCWSQVGHVGGIQLVSLGRGCESVGTAVHEIVHALGVWHEQARTDRDKYVKILDNNISTKFKPDFEIVSKRVAISRGFPYDYRSLMHYSKFAFTRNGRPTIEVIGIGKKLNMRIGQRKGLSTIDIAQIREMYNCNQKFDEKESVCNKGFKRISTNCYYFYPNTSYQFGPAFAKCQESRASLLILKTKRQERLVTKYMARKFPNVTSWRIGARRVNNMMMWKSGSGRYFNFTYSNWAKNHPSTYTSAILRKRKNDQYKWYGEWTGSASQRPKFQHAFVCEKRSKRKCVNVSYTDGQDYRGELDHTRGGYTCQKWTENYPQNHPLYNVSQEVAQSKNKTDEDGLGDHNHCRNPSGLRRNRPWCYTTKKKVEWDYCDVSACVKSVLAAEKERQTSTPRNVKRRKSATASITSTTSTITTATTTTTTTTTSSTKLTTNEKPRFGKSNYGSYSNEKANSNRRSSFSTQESTVPLSGRKSASSLSSLSSVSDSGKKRKNSRREGKRWRNYRRQSTKSDQSSHSSSKRLRGSR